MQVITIANQKGGCGKTITAVNLAGALSGAGKKVLFIDLDPQAHATYALGINIQNPSKSSYAMFDAFLNSMGIDFTLLFQRKYDNLQVIGSHLLLNTVEQKIADKEGAVLVLSEAVKSKELSWFDYIVIDTPPNLGFLTLNAMLAANRLIVPLDISLFSLNGVTQINKILEMSQGMGFKKPDVNYLITLFDQRSNFAKNFLQKVKDTFAEQLFRSVIRPNIKLREAALLGKVIFEHAPYANGAKDYKELVDEIAPELKELPINLKSASEDLSTPSIEPGILFKLNAPRAKNVYVAGSFNNWIVSDEYLMEKSGDGLWFKKLCLSAGKHLYKFIVDGMWSEDPDNNLLENDMMGGRNSVIVVK